MIDSDVIYEIIESRREELGLTQAQVSQLAFNRNDTSAIQNIKRGSSPSIDKLFKISKALNLECYFGPPRKEAEAIAEIMNEHSEAAQARKIMEARPAIKIHPVVDQKEYSFVNLHEVQASAGSGRVNGQEDQPSSIAFSNLWLNKIGINPDAASLIYVAGDSMEPTLKDGSIVLIDHQQREPVGKHVYAIRNGDELMVKRLEKPDGKTLLLTSDNPKYATKVLTGFDLDAVGIVGKVVWSAFTLDD